MTRRKDGLWQQQMTVVESGRKKLKTFYGHTKAEVLQKIAAYKDDTERGPLFEIIADEWWGQHEPTLAHNTAKSYEPAVKRAKEHFGKMAIRQIKPTDINLFMSRFIKDNHAALKTARTQLMMINLIYKYAVQNGYAEINPTRDLAVPRTLLKTAREMPTDEDIKLIKQSTDIPFGMFAYWILYTGCRRGELLALTWDDVDIDNRVITINKSVYHKNGRPYIKQPKSKAGIRRVPLMDKLYEKIKPGKGLIFPGMDGGLYLDHHAANMWRRYQAASGVTCTPHQLRHAYATMLFENEVSESDAQELLGHAQIATTKDIYTHIRESRKEKIRTNLLGADIS